ncbi:oxidoreductase C-terminal domain-containing protein [Streptomyces sp. L7]
MPYFFSDQYDLGGGVLRLEGGAPGSYDEVVIRGDAEQARVHRLLAAEGGTRAGRDRHVNVWDVTEPIQQLIRSGAQVNTEALADPHVPLDSPGRLRGSWSSLLSVRPP